MAAGLRVDQNALSNGRHQGLEEVARTQMSTAWLFRALEARNLHFC